MPHTRAQLLSGSLSFALGKVKVRIGSRSYPFGLHKTPEYLFGRSDTKNHRPGSTASK